MPTTFTHQALLYSSPDEFADAVVPFISDGTEMPAENVWEVCRVDAAFDEVCAFPGVSVVWPYPLKALPSDVIDRMVSLALR